MLIILPHVNRKVSEYAQVYRPHDYKAAPLMPIVMETLLNDKPKRRGTFAEHCRKGYVLGTDFENYRSCKICMKDTRATRISATVFNKHKYITNPRVTPEDCVIDT